MELLPGLWGGSPVLNGQNNYVALANPESGAPQQDTNAPNNLLFNSVNGTEGGGGATNNAAAPKDSFEAFEKTFEDTLPSNQTNQPSPTFNSSQNSSAKNSPKVLGFEDVGADFSAPSTFKQTSNQQQMQSPTGFNASKSTANSKTSGLSGAPSEHFSSNSKSPKKPAKVTGKVINDCDFDFDEFEKEATREVAPTNFMVQSQNADSGVKVEETFGLPEEQPALDPDEKNNSDGNNENGTSWAANNGLDNNGDFNNNNNGYRGFNNNGNGFARGQAETPPSPKEAKDLSEFEGKTSFGSKDVFIDPANAHRQAQNEAAYSKFSNANAISSDAFFGKKNPHENPTHSDELKRATEEWKRKGKQFVAASATKAAEALKNMRKSMEE